MSKKLNSAVAVIGIDIGKNSFHVVGHDKRGAIVLRQKWSRGQVETRLANLPPCLHRYGGLRRRASSQSQAPSAWPRRPPDAGEIRAPATPAFRFSILTAGAAATSPTQAARGSAPAIGLGT
jgi:hypothetical protein